MGELGSLVPGERLHRLDQAVEPTVVALLHGIYANGSKSVRQKPANEETVQRGRQEPLVQIATGPEITKVHSGAGPTPPLEAAGEALVSAVNFWSAITSQPPSPTFRHVLSIVVSWV